MTTSENQLNDFLVGIFNFILHSEECSLATGEFKNLSVTEMHIVDAVFRAQQQSTNTMALLANELMVTASTLTIGVKTLEQKGYIERKQSLTDRRKVVVTLTDRAEKAVEYHTNFHTKMVHSISSQLTEFEMQTLSNALARLHTFFSSKQATK